MFMSNKKNNLSVAEQMLNDMLKERAIQFGMCDRGKKEWRERKSLSSLLEMYVQNMEFILDHPDYVTNEFLLTHADDYTLHDHGIYVNEQFSITVPPDLIVRGECDGEVLCPCFSAPEMYVCDKSNVDIHVLYNSISYIRIYGHSKVNIKCEKGGKAFVYQFGGSVIYSGDGKVYVRERRHE